jgi:hypothetical protein
MKWNSPVLRCQQFAVSQESRRLRISGSASRSLRAWACRWSGSGGAACMTGLTWMRGSKNISTEDGPEGKLYGP